MYEIENLDFLSFLDNVYLFDGRVYLIKGESQYQLQATLSNVLIREKYMSGELDNSVIMITRSEMNEELIKQFLK